MNIKSFKTKLISDPKKLSRAFNHVLIMCELLFFLWFCLGHMYKILPVVIFNFLLSITGYFLIKHEKLQAWILTVYLIILDIMTAGTIAVGLGYGFQLYTISMISAAYYINYVGRKIYEKAISPKIVTFLASVSYFIGYYYVRFKGPIYSTNQTIENIFFVFNSLLVIGILAFYMSIFINEIRNSESKLEQIALVDKLTGLYNRHYMLTHIEKISKDDLNDYWIAILDIDNFKKVNDVYGHNCGDYVLQTVAHTAKDVCSDCTVCRWGGEEFIILAPESTCENDILEKLRKSIASLQMNYENKDIKVTVTIGTEDYSGNYGIDEWISYADQKLYIGKQSGKNKVVY